MKAALILAGGALTLLGAIMFLQGWIGPRVGDGFSNLGQIMVGLPMFLVGGIALGIGLLIGRNAGQNDN